ncbi:DUF1129 family protein [Alkalicoccobacillus porphyridii]|uniref:DUF1129 family protein n=1 Tax=Alkalicoccobacillus porphyridii TaxID=2597270 RepID=A0A553ZWJ2_9BACI|nr:DUF1129 family protein [Alkalicoccobacillus porphyridii]TSB45838.1 DUF1129 family protein [Alkalicoccobacillus porphyridii]
MELKELIEINNQKRTQLTKENLKYYEDMLVYIRLSFSKSEQETEEVLSELLDHLLIAQEEGKTAKEVFGDDPKQYCKDIIGELPKMITKERIRLFAMAYLYFLAASTFFTGLLTIFIYYIFNKGVLIEEYYIGTVLLKVVLSIPIAFLFLYVVVYYLRWACFKKINKILEFLIVWIYGIIFVGVFMLMIYLIPDLGSVTAIPVYILLLIGIMLYIAARITGAKK